MSLHRHIGVLRWPQFVECGLWLHYPPFHQLYQSIFVQDYSLEIEQSVVGIMYVWLFLNSYYLVYLLSVWLPSLTSRPPAKTQYTYLISNSFFLMNSCLNPVALLCTSSPFRQHLKRYLTCFCKTNSPPTDFELRRRNSIRNHSFYFLQLPLRCLFHTNFPPYKLQ
jgi:hypothetical protein